MPRGQTEILKDYRFSASSWKGKTKTVRLPVTIAEQVRELALWADQQDDPQAAVLRLLDYARTAK